MSSLGDLTHWVARQVKGVFDAVVRIRNVSRALATVCALLAGCYTSLNSGVRAPVGHGHGGAGVELDLAAGVEHVNDRLRVGGGGALGMRQVDENRHSSVGLDGHVAVAVSGQPYGDQWRAMVVANALFGLAQASASADVPELPSTTLFAEAFVGVGIGSPTEQRAYKIHAAHVALGVTVTRYWPDGRDSFWMLGGALQMSFGWLQER